MGMLNINTVVDKVFNSKFDKKRTNGVRFCGSRRRCTWWTAVIRLIRDVRCRLVLCAEKFWGDFGCRNERRLPFENCFMEMLKLFLESYQAQLPNYGIRQAFHSVSI